MLAPIVKSLSGGWVLGLWEAGDLRQACDELAGSVERGAINEPIPQPSAKDFFKMHNSTTPTDPQALKDRPVQKDPFSETQNAVRAHPRVFHTAQVIWSA